VSRLHYNAPMRRILIFSLVYYPRFIGGAEVATKEITDRISSDEVEFDMITLNGGGELPVEKIGNITVYRILNRVGVIQKFLFPWVAVFKIRKLMKKQAYDSFWAMMATFSSGSPYLFNMLQGMVGRQKVPITLTLQEGDSEKHFRSRWFGMINFSWKAALKRTAHLTVISHYLAERARKYGYTGVISLIPNGVAYEKFAKPITSQRKEEIRNELGLKKDDIILVTSSISFS
jgi:glycosyltransferase involved in cell wall biosynthesis